MAAAKIKFPVIEQGATFTHNFYWLQADGVTPVNLTGCTAKMQIRATVESPTVILELTTENTRITITPLAGKISFLISATDTTNLKEIKNAAYDLEIYHPNGYVTRLSQGTVNISPETTRG